MDSTLLAEKIKKRTEELQKMLSEFLKSWNSVEYHVKIKMNDNAAEAISTIYFEIVQGNLKGVYLKEDGFINRYKVASATEIACMLVKPLRFNDPSQPQTDSGINRINARLATTLALQILNGLHFKDFGIYLPAAKNENTLAAIGSHTYWVRYFIGDDNAYPVFLNSTFWEMYMSTLLLEQKED